MDMMSSNEKFNSRHDFILLIIIIEKYTASDLIVYI